MRKLGSEENLFLPKAGLLPPRVCDVSRITYSQRGAAGTECSPRDTSVHCNRSALSRRAEVYGLWSMVYDL